MIGDIQKSGVQTSFIPKKPLVAYGGKQSTGAGGILFFISMIVFVASLSILVGAYFYKVQLRSSIASITSDLEKMRTELSAKDSLMKEMIRFDNKLSIADELLNNHVSLRKMFSFFEGNTMQNLRYNDFNYIWKDTGEIGLEMGGEAASYSTIALQAREFVDSKSSGDKDFSNIIFSDLNPGLTGNVIFKMTSTVRPDLIRYANLAEVSQSI